MLIPSRMPQHATLPITRESYDCIIPLVGSRIGLDLTDRWAIGGEANVGGFGVGSDLAWNVQALLGYRTTVFGQDTIFAFGYRALHQNYDHKDFEWDVTMHGPVIGTAVRF